MMYSPFYRTRYMTPYKKYPNDNIYNYGIQDNNLNNKNKPKPKRIETKKEDKSICTDTIKIFGLSLHFDDIILISLLIIIFLDGIKDEMLFIVLLLLLLG